MNESLTDEQLRAKAWDVLKQHLGTLEAIRFLSMVRRQPRDYQRWRDEHFKNLNPDDLIRQLEPVDPKSK